MLIQIVNRPCGHIATSGNVGRLADGSDDFLWLRTAYRQPIPGETISFWAARLCADCNRPVQSIEVYEDV